MLSELVNVPEIVIATFSSLIYDCVDCWTDKWRIMTNTGKNQTMTLNKKRKLRRLMKVNPIRIADIPVPYSKHIKYLGIVFTDKIKLTNHNKNTISRATPIFKTLLLTSKKDTQLPKPSDYISTKHLSDHQ